MASIFSRDSGRSDGEESEKETPSRAIGEKGAFGREEGASRTSLMSEPKLRPPEEPDRTLRRIISRASSRGVVGAWHAMPGKRTWRSVAIYHEPSVRNSVPVV